MDTKTGKWENNIELYPEVVIITVEGRGQMFGIPDHYQQVGQ